MSVHCHCECCKAMAGDVDTGSRVDEPRKLRDLVLARPKDSHLATHPSAELASPGHTRGPPGQEPVCCTFHRHAHARPARWVKQRGDGEGESSSGQRGSRPPLSSQPHDRPQTLQRVCTTARSHPDTGTCALASPGGEPSAMATLFDRQCDGTRVGRPQAKEQPDRSELDLNDPTHRSRETRDWDSPSEIFVAASSMEPFDSARTSARSSSCHEGKMALSVSTSDMAKRDKGGEGGEEGKGERGGLY